MRHGGGGREGEGGRALGNNGFSVPLRNNKMYTSVMQSAQLRVMEEMGKRPCGTGMTSQGQNSSRIILFAKTLGSHSLLFL